MGLISGPETRVQAHSADTRGCNWLELSSMQTTSKCTPQQARQQMGPLPAWQQAAADCGQRLRGCSNLCTAANTIMHLPHAATRAGQHASLQIEDYAAACLRISATTCVQLKSKYFAHESCTARLQHSHPHVRLPSSAT